ncbi:MAG: exo-alpha-sialidase [Myxococcaceae bacterium]|nr:exo-alpha-sialidase [Myxococcaceae bacterium]
MLLSDTSSGNDEDPSVIGFAGGSLGVAFFSDRTGQGDIYLRAVDSQGVVGPLARVSSNPSPDFYPMLAQTSSGAVHAVWFRKVGGQGRVVHAVSRRVGEWGEEAEVSSPATSSDWTPALARTDGGALVVVFVRDDCYPRAPCFGLMTTRSGDEGVSWSTAERLHASGASDFLPTLARTELGVTLTWSRSSAGTRYPWETTSSETMVSSTADGVSWSEPVNLSQDATTDAFPTFLARPDAGTSVVWLSSDSKAAALVERSVRAGERRTLFPAPVTGYSHRFAVLSDGRLFSAWVQGPEGNRRVYGRVTELP